VEPVVVTNVGPPDRSPLKPPPGRPGKVPVLPPPPPPPGHNPSPTPP
jgi:hypothetical protein